jgi:hypothetical protein
MARLILEEDGKRRAFNLNDGCLTVGSGESSALTLSSPDVADVHAELRVEDGVVTLVPCPGVLPPTVLGRPVTQATRLPANAEFKIGSAVFRLESAQAEAAKGIVRQARPAVQSRGAADTSQPSRIEYRRRTVNRGMPGWMVVGILGVVLLVAYFVGKTWMADGAEQFDPAERYRVAVAAYESGAYRRAEDELDNVDLTLAGEDLKKKVIDLREKVTDARSVSHVAEHNMKGSEWMDDNLKKYVSKHLSGDKGTRAAARFFVKRCDEFRKTWPEHPDLDWVDRYRGRYAKLAEMNSPAEFDDLAWEVKRLTAGKPRDYARVFGEMDGFISRAGGQQLTAAQALHHDQTTEREAYFLDRMQEAQYQWKKQAYGQAVEWLVQVIVKIGDEQMADQAVDAFLKMQTTDGEPLSDRYLLTYQKNRPEQFEILMGHSKMRSAAKAAGIL